MPNWRKVITSGSDAVLHSLQITDGLALTGSFTHTGSYSLDGILRLNTINNAGTDTDKFLVLDSSGDVDFRTGTEVLNDIGAAATTDIEDWLRADVNDVKTAGYLRFNDSIQLQFGTSDDVSTLWNGSNMLMDFGAAGGDLLIRDSSASTALQVESDTKDVTAGRYIKGVTGLKAGRHVVSTYDLYNFPNGCYIETNIADNSNTMIELHIWGNRYSSTEPPIDTRIQAYHFNSGNDIINRNGIANGFPFDIDIFCEGGFVKFWFAQPGIFNTVHFSLGSQGDDVHITSITNAAKPTTGLTKDYTITPIVSLTDSNFINSTPSGSQIAVWFNSSSLEGDSNLIWSGTTLEVTGNISGSGCITIGSGNLNLGVGSSITGGQLNSIGTGNNFSFIGGGYNNTVSSTCAVVTGGILNLAKGAYSTVGGGASNTASGSHSVVSGGSLNNSDGVCSFIGGGSNNSANANLTTIGGGISNIASGPQSFIGGGCGNQATNTFTTIGGGCGNCATGICSFIGGGRRNTTSGTLSTIGGGFLNTATNSYSVALGGLCNCSLGAYSSVGGGLRNQAKTSYGTVAGGCGNIANATYSTVGGGFQNTASSSYSTVGGGYCNATTSTYSTVAGGRDNTSSGAYSVVAGGQLNTSDGSCSGILGGTQNNICSKVGSFIVGFDIDAQSDYTTFVNNIAHYAHSDQTSFLGQAEVAGELIYVGSSAVTAGNLYYLSGSTTSTWELADADADTTSTNMLAIAAATGNSNEVGMLIRGYARFAAVFNLTGGTIGGPLYISTTAGAITQTAPSGTKDVVRIVGHLLDRSAEVIYFNPDNYWTEIP